MNPNNHISIVILAAGQGKRMKNPDLPKVLAELDAKPLIWRVLTQARELSPKTMAIIIGHQREKVIEYVDSLGFPEVKYAVQNEQLGTGHAVMQAKDALGDTDGSVLILCGDVPLLRAKTMADFIANHKDTNADLSVLTAIADDPTGYGRIVRDADGEFERIVEHKDSSENEKLIKEINSGVYFVGAKVLFTALEKVGSNNVQGEYYLTDIVEILKKDGKKVVAYDKADIMEIQGVNSPEQLAALEEYYYKTR